MELERHRILTPPTYHKIQNSASQIVVALLVSVSTSALYIHWQPFERDSDDNLAITTQISLFLTLLAALLKKVEVDKTDKYDEFIFGIILIIVNCLSAAMIAFSQVSKPINLVMEAMLGERHEHDGVLRGMNEEETVDREGFVRHFVNVATSSEEDGGWMPYTNRDVKWVRFVEYSKAVVERRCSTGKGAVDETRATFQVECGIDKLKKYLLNQDRDLRYGDLESHPIGGQQTDDDSRRVFYVAKKMKGAYSPRDYVLEGFGGELQDDSFYIVRRSIDSESLYSLKKSSSAGRVRAKVRYEGYVLSSAERGKATKVVYVENVDPGGLLKGLIVCNVLPEKLRDSIDDLLAFVQESALDCGSEGFIGGSGDDDLEEGGLEMARAGGLTRTAEAEKRVATISNVEWAPRNPLRNVARGGEGGLKGGERTGTQQQVGFQEERGAGKQRYAPNN